MATITRSTGNGDMYSFVTRCVGEITREEDFVAKNPQWEKVEKWMTQSATLLHHNRHLTNQDFVNFQSTLKEELPLMVEDKQQLTEIQQKTSEVMLRVFRDSDWKMERTLGGFVLAVFLEAWFQGQPVDEIELLFTPLQEMRDCMLTRQVYEDVKQVLLSNLAGEQYEEISKLLDQTFSQRKWTNMLAQTDFDKLLTDYQKMLDQVKVDTGHDYSCYQNHSWPGYEYPFSLTEDYSYTFDWNNLEVTLPFDVIHRIYETAQVIQLKEIDPDADTLIIGCGNGRLVNAGGAAFAFNLFKENYGITPATYHRDYSLKHLHQGEVTIDPNLASNPTVVAAFGDQPIAKVFKGKKFKKIIFEGYFDYGPQKYRAQDISALLEKDGQIFSNNGVDGICPLDPLRCAILKKKGQ